MDNIANKFSPEPFSLAFPLDHDVDPCGIGGVEHHPHTMIAGPPGRASALQNYPDAIANQPLEDAEARHVRPRRHRIVASPNAS